MSEELFQVVFDGAMTGEFDEPTTRAKMARLFRLDEKRVARLFSGKPQVIKKNITEAVAMDYMIKLAEAGCECYVQEMPDPDAADYDEKRNQGERRQRFRRGPRPGAIVPDRRLRIRRKTDRRELQRLLEHKRELPLCYRSYNADAAEDQ